MEHVPNMTVLFIGRIMGGISTNLLFSAFESWMVSEHRKLKFNEKLLSSTFAISSWGNGLVAILAGFIAQYSVTNLNYGDIGIYKCCYNKFLISSLTSTSPQNTPETNRPPSDHSLK